MLFLFVSAFNKMNQGNFILIGFSVYSVLPQVVYIYIVCMSQLRLAIWLILNAREDHFFVLLATVCSSWVYLNRGTSRRSWLIPEGDCSKGYIRDANTMTSRSLGRAEKTVLSGDLGH